MSETEQEPPLQDRPGYRYHGADCPSNKGAPIEDCTCLDPVSRLTAPEAEAVQWLLALFYEQMIAGGRFASRTMPAEHPTGRLHSHDPEGR